MNVPTPPTPDPRQRRHNTKMILRAKQLVEGGWTNGQTARRLAEEYGLSKPPAATTIRRWTEPGYVEVHRAWQEKSKRRAKNKPATTTPEPFELTDELLLKLRLEDGLPYPVISKIARRFYAVDLDPDQLRYRLNALGAPKNPKKVRAMSRRAA